MEKTILQDNRKLSVKYEAHENINSEVDDSYLYGIDNMSLDGRKEFRKRAFGIKPEKRYNIKNQNGMTFIHNKCFK